MRNKSLIKSRPHWVLKKVTAILKSRSERNLPITEVHDIDLAMSETLFRVGTLDVVHDALHERNMSSNKQLKFFCQNEFNFLNLISFLPFLLFLFSFFLSYF